MTYHVHLDVYEGPFDLLLQLIARRRLDITEIDLAEITHDFLEHLGAALEELDLDTATRFLVVAATLVELKAARLLPKDEQDDAEDLLGDARDMLYARLLEYRAFRDVARLMEHRFDRCAGSLARDVAPEPWILRLVPETALPINVDGLAALAAAATAPRPKPEIDLAHIRRTYLTIRDAARQVLDALPSVGSRVDYRTLVTGRDRGDRVVVFLALLELFKLGHVELEQSAGRGPIEVERRDGWEDLASLTDDYEQPSSYEMAPAAVGGDTAHSPTLEKRAG
ncbi:MAG: ScpA family protein [Nitriliruptoraceae bacterium]